MGAPDRASDEVVNRHPVVGLIPVPPLFVHLRELLHEDLDSSQSCLFLDVEIQLGVKGVEQVQPVIFKIQGPAVDHVGVDLWEPGASDLVP